jgi:hypothetical protein
MRNIPRDVDLEIRSACGGRWPRTKAAFVRAAARFDHEVRFYPPGFLPEHSCTTGGVIHVPDIPPGAAPRPCHIHELAEACLQWEGRAPYIVAEPQSQTRHEVARCVDLTMPRERFTPELQRQIRRTAGRLAALLEAAAMQSATVYVLAPGQYAVDLKHTEH